MNAHDAKAAPANLGFESQIRSAFRKVLQTYAQGLHEADISCEDLTLLLMLSPGARQRDDVASELDAAIGDAEPVISDAVARGLVQSDGQQLSLAQRGQEVLRQVQSLAQTANQQWRASAASAARDPADLQRLLALLQSPGR